MKDGWNHCFFFNFPFTKRNKTVEFCLFVCLFFQSAYLYSLGFSKQWEEREESEHNFSSLWNLRRAACQTHAWPCAHHTSIKSPLLSSFFSTLFPHSSHSAWVYRRKLARAGPWRKMEARTWRSRSCFCISMRRSISCPVRLCVTSSSASPTASLSPSPSLLACQVPVPPPLSSSPLALPKLLPAPSPWDSAGIVLIIHIFWKRNRITMKTIHLLIPLGWNCRYLAAKSEADHYMRELKREQEEIITVPDMGLNHSIPFFYFLRRELLKFPTSSLSTSIFFVFFLFPFFKWGDIFSLSNGVGLFDITPFFNLHFKYLLFLYYLINSMF